jgi:DNA-binding GntR family transcriptional regulator
MMGEFSIRTRLVEERIAVELGVSRTPVREAMRRLLSDGLVVKSDAGYYVSIPDLAGLRNLYETRTTLEVRGVLRALESPAFVHDEIKLAILRDEWRELWHDRPQPNSDFVVMDEDFHGSLLAAAGNEVLSEMLQTVNARIRPVRMYDYLTEERIERTISQHVQIVEAVLEKQYDAAAALLRGHIAESMDNVERQAAHALSLMSGLGSHRS